MNLQKLLLLLLILSPFSNLHSQSTDLYKTISKMDSIFFHAYNTCDLQKQSAIYADKVEFYHDKSGLDTSKQNILASTEKYICGKVTRDLLKGSIEVSPIPGYGAVELGQHSFRNKMENNSLSKPSKFVIIWKNEGETWKITKVISLH